MLRQTGAKLENDQIHARLITAVGLVMSVTFFLMVIGLMYGL